MFKVFLLLDWRLSVLFSFNLFFDRLLLFDGVLFLFGIFLVFNLIIIRDRIFTQKITVIQLVLWCLFDVNWCDELSLWLGMITVLWLRLCIRDFLFLFRRRSALFFSIDGILFKFLLDLFIFCGTFIRLINWYCYLIIFLLWSLCLPSC